MNVLLALISAIHFIIVALLWIRLRRVAVHDIFHPVKIIYYFYLLTTFGFVWFAFRPDSLQKFELQYVPVTDAVVTLGIVIGLSFIGFLAALGGAMSGVRRKSNAGKISSIIYAVKKNKQPGLVFGIVMFAVGFYVYMIFINQIGGLEYFFENIWRRSELTGGKGYLSFAYNILIALGVLIIYLNTKGALGNTGFLFFVCVGLLVLASTGARSPALILIFYLFLARHYLKKRTKNLFNVYTLTLVPILTLFIVVWVLLQQVKHRQAFQDKLVDPYQWRLYTHHHPTVVFRDSMILG